jgi:hypothetical protein
MHIPGLAQEYERTCDDCGCVWRVPKGLAHPHMQGLPMQGTGIGMKDLADDAIAVADANAELAERAEALRHCPQCESNHYEQRPIRS